MSVKSVRDADRHVFVGWDALGGLPRDSDWPCPDCQHAAWQTQSHDGAGDQQTVFISLCKPVHCKFTIAKLHTVV